MNLCYVYCGCVHCFELNEYKAHRERKKLMTVFTLTQASTALPLFVFVVSQGTVCIAQNTIAWYTGSKTRV